MTEGKRSQGSGQTEDFFIKLPSLFFFISSLFSSQTKLREVCISSPVTMTASERSPVARAGTIKSAIVRSVFTYSSTRIALLSSGCFHAGKVPGVARSVCWSMWISMLHFCIHHFQYASCQNAKACLWLSMIHVGTREVLRETKCFNHFPAVIFPSTSHSITVSFPVTTSSSVPVMRFGTTIVLFARSSKLRRLLEMAVEMMRGEEYMRCACRNTIHEYTPKYTFFYETNDYGHQAHRDISAYW